MLRDNVQRDLLYIESMLDNALSIEEDIKRFAKLGIPAEDESVLKLVSFSLSQIGEQVARGKLSEELQEKYSYVEWSKINGLRNFIVHDYSKIVPSRIIATVKNQIPNLIEELFKIREDLKREIDNEY